MLITNFRLKYLLYQVVMSGYQLLDTGRLHPVRERAIRALNASVDYVEQHMPNALGFDTQKEVLVYGINQTKVAGHHLEFGVFTGGTIRFLAHLKPAQLFAGFDSFEGLPEAWDGFNLGAAAFFRGGKLPKVPRNVKLYKGWFSETLPVWRRETSGPVAFVHIDCDLYSSTVEILEALADRFQPGAIIVFDEYFNYSNWQHHEFRAWREFVEKYAVSYEYLAYARQQVAVRINELGT